MTESTRIALVLGATGGIGGETALALARHGWKIRAFARGTSPSSEAQGWDWIIGDAMDQAPEPSGFCINRKITDSNSPSQGCGAKPLIYLNPGSSLLTEGLQVRVILGEPNYFSPLLRDALLGSLTRVSICAWQIPPPQVIYADSAHC